MGKKVTTTYQQKKVAGTELDFDTEKEPWSVYEAEDGSRIRVKTVVAKIIRLDDVYTENDEPVYVINSQPFVVADVNEKLKKPKQ